MNKPKVKGEPTERDRGKFRFQKGQAGHTDFMEVCLRRADGSYVWQRLVTQ